MTLLGKCMRLHMYVPVCVRVCLYLSVCGRAACVNVILYCLDGLRPGLASQLQSAMQPAHVTRRERLLQAAASPARHYTESEGETEVEGE